MNKMLSNNTVSYIIFYALFLIGLSIFYKIFKNSRVYIGKQKEKEDFKSATGLIEHNLYVLNFYNISFQKYNSARELVLIFFVGLSVLEFLVNSAVNTQYIGIGLILYIFTYPSEKLYSVPTLTGLLVKILRSKYTKDVDREIYNIVGWMKSAAICQQEDLVNPLSIIENALEMSDRSSEAFVNVMGMWQLGKFEEGTVMFSEYFKTEYCKKFSVVLSSLNELNITDLVCQLEYLEAVFRKENYTKYLARTERNSLALYGLVIVGILIVLLNFVYVGIFIDTMDRMLNL